MSNMLPVAGEVLVELTGGGIESVRVVEQARADAVGQRLQDRLVILGGVGDPHEAGLGGSQQQAADRGVDHAVGDIEHALDGGRRRQTSVESIRRRRDRPRPAADGWDRVGWSSRAAFRCGDARIGASKVGDAVGGGAPGGRRAAAEDDSDLGVREPGDVVVGHRLALLVGQRRQGGGEIGIGVTGGRIIALRGGAGRLRLRSGRRAGCGPGRRRSPDDGRS